MEKAKHKVCYYCFVAAIQSSNLQVPALDKGGNMAGLVPSNMLVFLPESIAGPKRDYYKVFNGNNYL